jgi:hypothetical protein
VRVKAAAPPALVSHGKKNGKPHGAKGPSSALALSPGKGKTSFLSLMSARAALAGKKPELPVSLDNPRLLLLKVALAAAFDGRKAPVGATATGVQRQAAAGAQAQPEKTDLRKRTGRLHSADSLAAGLTLTGPAPTPGAQKTVDVNKRDMAADAAAMPGSAKTGTAHHASLLVRVVDLRTKVDTEDSTAARTVGGTAAADKDAGVPFAQRLAGTRNAPADPPQKAVPAAPSQAQTALERLQDMAGSELLRATNLVLKDGGGEIRLVLKPDSLGSVRIRMNLVDNAIEGRIIVDSSSVKQVVDGSIDALRRALTAEGFQTGSLQVSVGGQNADTGSRQEQQPPQAIRRITAQGFDRNVPGVENIGLEDLLVNLFV